MPKSTREWAKRKIDEAIQNINWSGTHVNAVIERYETEHKEISDPLVNILELLVMAQDLLKKVGGSF